MALDEPIQLWQGDVDGNLAILRFALQFGKLVLQYGLHLLARVVVTVEGDG